jgi:hypothetical protein
MAKLGKHQLVMRLSEQVGDKGMAIAILKKRGDLKQKGAHTQLTAKGAKRDNMTAGQRAKDRASKSSGKSTKSYSYDPKTNRATLKRLR